MSARWAAVPRRERLLLGAIVGVALVVRIAYVALHGGAPLNGDEIEYALEGKLAANGHWFWSTTPYGIAHASIFKAPLYPAWVGAWFSVFGEHARVVMFAQAFISAGTVALTWLLARRLFGPTVALASEPLLVVIACSSAVPALSSLRAGRRLRRSGTGLRIVRPQRVVAHVRVRLLACGDCPGRVVTRGRPPRGPDTHRAGRRPG